MPVKVAHITTIDFSLRYLLLNQLHSIQHAGYDVTGISSPGSDVPALSNAGVRHIPVHMTRNFTPLADLVSLWRLFRVLRRERFTIVHTHNPKPGLLGQLAARLAGVPVVVNTLHGFYFHKGMAPLWRHFYILMEKIAARCSDIILSQNREDIETALAAGICRPDQIEFLGNGIDVHLFNPARIDSQILAQKREELGLDPARPVVGFVGRLVAEKGILELMQAARLILAKRSDVQFLLVGPIDKHKDDALTPAVARDYGVDAASVFAGLRHDMPDMFALMDMFVLPSHREGFPRALMEAAAMGVPAVATDIRGCREAVEDGRNGLLVPLGDVDALAEALLELLDNKTKAARMGEVGRQIALERFDERVVFARVQSAYQRLLLEKGLPLPSDPHSADDDARFTEEK